MKKLLSVASVAFASALACAGAQAAVVLSITPSATQIAVGDTVNLNVSISGLDAEVLSGFDLNFLFNGSVLNFATGAYFGAPLGTQLDGTTLTPGNLGYDAVSLELDATLAANQANSFQLFSISFTGSTDGTSTFTLGGDPDFERLFTGLNANPLVVDVGSVCIAVGQGACPAVAVPEPASLGLAGLALAACGLPAALRRRRATAGVG